MPRDVVPVPVPDPVPPDVDPVPPERVPPDEPDEPVRSVEPVFPVEPVRPVEPVFPVEPVPPPAALIDLIAAVSVASVASSEVAALSTAVWPDLTSCRAEAEQVSVVLSPDVAICTVYVASGVRPVNEYTPPSGRLAVRTEFPSESDTVTTTAPFPALPASMPSLPIVTFVRVDEPELPTQPLTNVFTEAFCCWIATSSLCCASFTAFCAPASDEPDELGVAGFTAANSTTSVLLVVALAVVTLPDQFDVSEVDEVDVVVVPFAWASSSSASFCLACARVVFEEVTAPSSEVPSIVAST